MSVLNNIKQKNILVVGDVMLDTYFYGDVKRISPEAPVPVFAKKEERSVLGGAANVAANLISAGQNVFLMTVVGKDQAGEEVKRKFKEKGINIDFVFVTDRNTTVKTRFLASNNQQVMRLDVEDSTELQECDYEKILLDLDERIDQFDLILLSDYLKGFLSFDFTQKILKMAKENGIPAIVDVKEQKAEKYKGAYLLKPNKRELANMTGMKVSNDSEIIEAAQELREKCECMYVLATCGARGMVLVSEEEPYFIESVGKEVYDVTGAGDTTIAYLAACMVNHIPMKKSMEIANYAAGIQVSKVGTSEVVWQEIRDYMSEQLEGSRHKLIDGKIVEELRENYRNKKIVFTNGCFDILHTGHIRYLQETAKQGDVLVVGLNSDSSVRRLKGPERPINNEQDRAELLCALEFVDYVIIFEEDTPYELIKKIQPDVLVKGGDYNEDNVVGTDIVKANGGKLVLVPFVEGKSTTNIVNKILG